MTVLDLDLDFFLSDVVTWPIGDRADSRTLTPWTIEAVVFFLENNCGLSTRAKTPGSIVTTHDEVFYIWRDLIESEQLEIPFNVVHIDAHADLGMGFDSSYATICSDIVNRPIPQKYNPPKGGYDGIYEGNYLAYALACRWISNLLYVRHPNSKEDLMPIYFKDRNVSSNIISIPIYDSIKKDDPFFEETNEPIGFEPDIKFKCLLPEDYQSESKFDFIFLAKSPKYTPTESDPLVDLIKEYIHII